MNLLVMHIVWIAHLGKLSDENYNNKIHTKAFSFCKTFMNMAFKMEGLMNRDQGSPQNYHIFCLFATTFHLK
jgi:hypothetical protein